MSHVTGNSGSSVPPAYSPAEDWKESPHAALIRDFGTHRSILKIRGHANRPDFLYLSDEPGYFTIYRWDPDTQEGAKVLLDEEPVADSASSGDFLLHPYHPWIVYSKPTHGERAHSLYLLDYKTGRVRRLVDAIGTVEFLLPYNVESLIAVVTTQEHIQLLAISYEGETRTLFATDQQVLSIAASDRQEVIALALGPRLCIRWIFLALWMSHAGKLDLSIAPALNRGCPSSGLCGVQVPAYAA